MWHTLAQIAVGALVAIAIGGRVASNWDRSMFPEKYKNDEREEDPPWS